MSTLDSSPFVEPVCHLKIVHQIAGRVRFRLRDLYRNAAMKQRLETELKRVEGIHQVRIDTRTGSLLVHYREEQFVPGLLFRLVATLASARPCSGPSDKRTDTTVEQGHFEVMVQPRKITAHGIGGFFISRLRMGFRGIRWCATA